MTLTFSPQQDTALQLISRWYKGDHRMPFVLNGYAGTGKTTIAKYLPEMIGASDPSEVIYTAFTGKAALQLRRKGCPKATTLHKLLYKPLEKEKTKLQELAKQLQGALVNDPTAQDPVTRAIKTALIAERRRVMAPSWSTNPDYDRIEKAKIIVVDESSMVDEKIAKDLLELGLPIIYCGDPFQLPPVRGKSPVSEYPVNMTLTEVHRQALENPILRVATELRNGKYNLSQQLSRHVTGSEELIYEVKTVENTTYEDYRGHDQVLCGRNATRSKLNHRTRAKRLASGEVRDTPGSCLGEGDRVVFLRNDYDEDVFNGTIGIVDTVLEGDKDEDHIIVSGSTDEDTFDAYEVWAGILKGQEISEAPRFTQVIDLAYALTVHKSQGSEWDSVLVQYEPIGRGTDQQRWLYTAMTRARKKCTIVMPRD